MSLHLRLAPVSNTAGQGRGKGNRQTSKHKATQKGTSPHAGSRHTQWPGSSPRLSARGSPRRGTASAIRFCIRNSRQANETESCHIPPNCKRHTGKQSTQINRCGKQRENKCETLTQCQETSWASEFQPWPASTGVPVPSQKRSWDRVHTSLLSKAVTI